MSKGALTMPPGAHWGETKYEIGPVSPIQCIAKTKRTYK